MHIHDGCHIAQVAVVLRIVGVFTRRVKAVDFLLQSRVRRAVRE